MLQDKILDYLEDKKEHRAVKWFQQYMTGPGEGQWMHAHSNIGSAPNNMGNESYFRWTKLATNSKKQVSLNHFLGGFISYAANVNHEEFSKISDMLPILPQDLKPTQMTPFAYPSRPVISMKLVDMVQSMDWDCVRTMRLSDDVAETECARFHTMMDDARNGFCDAVLFTRDVRVVTVGEAMQHVETTFRATTHFRQVIMATHRCVQNYREKYGKDHFIEELRLRQEWFKVVCIDETLDPEMKDMIRLSEEFVLCEALESKWSDEVRHKCSCPCFFRYAVCEHVVVLAMLADPTKKVLPSRNDIRRIRQRASKKRGRPAADGDSDSLDEPRKKPKGREPKEKVLQPGLLSDLESPAEVRSIIP